jgi:AcrR family transcriptional regulator
MPPADRRTRENAAVAGRILDAARALFAKEGVDAVTMRKIAAAIDYTPAALYVHFRDKDALIRALCRNDFGALAAQMARLNRVADPVERIRKMGRAYIRFAADHPSHYRVMFMTPLDHIEPEAQDLADMGDPEKDGYAAFVAAIEQALHAGLFHPYLTDAGLIAQTMWAGLHGVVTLHITHENDPWVDLRPLATRARVMLDTLLEGMTRKADETVPTTTRSKP